MSIRLFSQGLILIFILALLSACGGGSDEPSGLLTDTGGNVGGDPPFETDTFTSISVSLGAQQIIPSGGSSTISLTTFIADADREGEIAPNVSLRITIHPADVAVLKNVPTGTNANGDASFTVSHPGSGNVIVNISGNGTVRKGFDIPLYFGATATSELTTKGTVLADGKTPAEIKVLARDWAGIPITGIPVNLSFPIHSFAVPTETSGHTDENGEFTTGITNTVAQSTKVTPIAGGTATGSLTLDFGASSIVTIPEVLDLITKNNNVLANGSATATLIVIARDAAGTPIPYIPVSISSDSATAQLSINASEASELFISGNTGKIGNFELNITNAVEEEVNIIATTTSGNEFEETAQTTVIFTSEPSEEPDTSVVAKIELDAPLNNNQPANGENKIYLRGRVLDQANNPLPNQTVSIIVSGGSASISADNLVTDDSGRFSASLTDEFAEEFTAKAVIGNISSDSVTVKFIAVPIESEDEEEVIQVHSITLLASPAQQIPNGTDSITLTAIVRDINNTPLSGVPVSISSSSRNVIFDQGAVETGNGGTAIFQITSTIAEENITVTVRASSATGFVSDSTSVTFVATTLNVNTLDVSVVNNNQPANGTDPIKIDVVARDSSGRPVGGAPIIVQMAAGTTAVADPSRKETDDNGFFTTNIVSTQAVKDIGVTIAVEGTSVTNSLNITFKAIQVGAADVTPASLELQINPTTQPADGESKIALIVIPRDDSKTPLAGVSVILISDSDNAQIVKSADITNELGEFRTTVTSDTAQTFNITAVVEGMSDPSLRDTKPINFVAVDSGAIDFQVINAQQPADGNSVITLVVTFSDASGNPIPNAEVKFIDDSTNIDIAGGNTNALGEFRTTVTSSVAETIQVTPVINDIVGKQETIIFRAELGTIDFQVSNDHQPADEKSTITLIVTFHDSKGNPIVGAEVTFIDESPDIEIAGGNTNALGEYRTTITSSVPGAFNITPVVNGLPGETKTITYVTVGTDVTDLTVNIVNNNQVADGETSIQINVVARDSGGRPVSGVPIVVQIATGEIAVASPARDITNDDGFFSTTVTSTEAGEAQITISIEGTSIAASPVLVNFIAEIGITPTTVELIAKNAPQPADSLSTITLVVIPRDARNVPVAGVDVELIKDTDEITIAQETGTTNLLGEFRTTVVSTNDLTDSLTSTLVVNVTPVAGGIIGDATPIVFTPVSIVIPATLTLSVINNNQETGQEITLTVLARDDNGFPLGNVPVKLSVTHGDELPDVTGSAIFGTNGFQGITAETSGVFETTIKNTQPGTFKVTAAVLARGGEPVLNSNTIDVIFKGAPTAEVKEVSSIRLIASPPQLGSEGSSEGVVLTAVVKNKDNNLVEGAVISFSSTCLEGCVSEHAGGEIQLIQIEGSSGLPGVTDVSGRADARLTTIGNADNRTIRITATVPTTTGKTKEAIVDIEVIGTTITVTGPENIVFGDTVNISIFLNNSDNDGIGGQMLSVTSEKGNTIDNSSPVTNATGQANIKLTADSPNTGQDTITVSKEGAFSGELVVNISDDNFTLDSEPTGHKEITLNTPQKFFVHWDKQGTPQPNEFIYISSTRGDLKLLFDCKIDISGSSDDLKTDDDGNACFEMSANNSGPAIITASAIGGPEAQISIDFIATDADSITLQADPVSIAVNTADSEAQQSEIVAVVRDPENNLVKGKRIDFTLQDVTGGRLFPSSATTDSFGRASTIYTAGISPSAANGVKITAMVTDKPIVNASTHLTVAAKSLFVTLGTGNEIEKDGPTRYKHPYTVLVNDANGVAIKDTEVTLSVLPLKFKKGYYLWDKENEVWTQVATSICVNEDALSDNPGNHFNGILDADEDLNMNGKLEPGNVATFDSGGTVKMVETDANGFADFYIVYPQQYANWVSVRLIATTTVAGSEGTVRNEFWLRGVASDYNDFVLTPPGHLSFYGIGFDIATTEDVNGNRILDPDEDGLILFNGILDTEDKNGNGILDLGEDGTILSHIDENGIEVYKNPRVGELDTEDLNGNGRLDAGEDVNRNGRLDITYVNTCNDPS
ncbi:MAG: hypothetical protein DRQ57_03595 [Gammaproteobacteria bacterium]|nr:MAG: hypothetical protein DRQ57_03595 [Gammaproteobacteria bacterium]